MLLPPIVYITHDHTHYHARSRTISARTPRYTASTARLGPSQPNQEYLSNGGLPLIQLRHTRHAHGAMSDERRSSRGRRGEREVARLPRRVTARIHRACLNPTGARGTCRLQLQILLSLWRNRVY